LVSIELTNLSKSFGRGVPALHPLDLSIPAGELLVVLGPSGSGKTTLLRLIAGLELPTSGSVLLGDVDATILPAHRRDVAMVFQHPALYPHLSVFDNIGFGLRARGVPRSQLRSEVKTIAGILELDQLLGRRPAELSGGERQRVAIGRALVRRPRVVLLDEPFSNLDAPLRAGLREQVVDLQRRFGTTLIHVTHDQAEALVMGHRLAVFDGGRLQQTGVPRAIYERPANRFVATFVGSPPINIVPCQIEPDGEAVRIHPIAAETSLKWVVARDWLPGAWDGTPRQLDLGIRPETLCVGDSEGSIGTGPTFVMFPAQVRNLEFNGADVLAVLDAGQHRMAARLSTGLKKVAVRDRVTVAVDMRRISWFDPATGALLPPVSTGDGT
jgi:ABC-type sugar transport system ATPase subunit